ncbi:uncharacterized protein LOC112847256 [Oreochromis niloticus]|uniref:uncharacterized protein LOC112847256 n=1 Tax=Oreochromis niloticus TaxID=8128 RepID=UPI000DF349AB|nr:uncharacterized protein LOC112847256 [Oreochromis niloticus]
MDPAACDPSEELRDDIIFSVENLLSLWLEHPPEELRRALETRLQRLFSGLPWLLGSLSPTIQAFLQRAPHLLSATPASLPDSPDVILPGPSEPSAGRKCRSRRRRATPQPDIRTFNSPVVVSEGSLSDCVTVHSGALPDSPVHSMQGEGFMSTQCTFQGLAAVGTVSHSRASPEAGSRSPANSGPLRIEQPPGNHFMSAWPGKSQCSVHRQSPPCQLVASMTAGLVMASAGGSVGPLRPSSPVSAGGSEGPLRPSSPVSAGGSEGPLRPSSPVSAGGSKGSVQPVAAPRSPASTPPPAAAPRSPASTPPPAAAPRSPASTRRQLQPHRPRRRLQRFRLRLPRQLQPLHSRQLQRLRLRLPRRRQLQRLRLRLPRRRQLQPHRPRRRLQRFRPRFLRRRLQRVHLRLPRQLQPLHSRQRQRLHLRLPRQLQPLHSRQLQRLHLRLPRRCLQPLGPRRSRLRVFTLACSRLRVFTLACSRLRVFTLACSRLRVFTLACSRLRVFTLAAAASASSPSPAAVSGSSPSPAAAPSGPASESSPSPAAVSGSSPSPAAAPSVATVAFRTVGLRTSSITLFANDDAIAALTVGHLNCFHVASAAFRTAGPLNCLDPGAVGPLAGPLNCFHVAAAAFRTAGPLNCLGSGAVGPWPAP